MSTQNENEILQWVNTQEKKMIQTLLEWTSINSFTENSAGLEQMLQKLVEAFQQLKGDLQFIELPAHTITEADGARTPHNTGRALHITKRPNAPIQILFGGHMDTVYPPTIPLHLPHINGNKIIGQGVADMKGGLLILLVALQALEQHPNASKIGWEVLITSDEEIGSPASQELWNNAAQRTHYALLFEPAFPDGALVNERGGSANWSVFSTGIAAHSGRDFHKGRNAIVALSKWIEKVDQLNGQNDATLNIGYIYGGGPVNIVPGQALCRVNARVKSTATFDFLDNELKRLAKDLSSNGIQLSVELDSYRAPKPLNAKTQQLIEIFNTCAQKEGYELHYRASSGVCDGNTVADAGIPVLDSLGVIGSGLHTPEETADLDSLLLRCRLVTRFLLHMCQR